jgi:hypothetical protein
MKRRPTAMVRSAALVGTAVLILTSLAGCSEPTPTGQADPSPTTPDISQLDVAVRYQEERRGANGRVVVHVACAAGVSWDGAFYVIQTGGLPGVSNPQASEPLEGVVVPGCNDSGNLDPDRPTQAWSIEGVDSDRAILVEYP